MILCYALALHAPWLIRRRSGCCSALGLVRRDFVMLFFLQGNFCPLECHDAGAQVELHASAVWQLVGRMARPECIAARERDKQVDCEPQRLDLLRCLLGARALSGESWRGR